MRRRRRRLDLATREAAGSAVVDLVVASAEFRRADRVALYASLPDELPTEGLLREVLGTGRSLLLPRAGAGRRLEFSSVRDLTALVEGSFGTREPSASCAPVRLQPDDLVLIPGVAFDRSGHRLGRGGGWYDRSLSAALPAVFGIGFAFQLIESVPATPLDRCVAGVFTERELWRVAGAGGPAEVAGNPG